MKICTWNVNELNAGLGRVVEWLHRNQPDIVGLQEAKTSDHEAVVSAFRSEGYRGELPTDSDGKSRGPAVAILSKHPLEVTRVGIPGHEDRGARLLTARTAGLSFTTVCVPIASGKGSTEQRVKRKLAWLDALIEHLRERNTDDVPAVLCGDFNINPKPVDNYHYWQESKEPKSSPGFRECERSRISSLLKGGWCDLVRECNPEKKMFSYWHSRNLYNEDKGLRIDLVFGNAPIVKRLESAWIDQDHYAEDAKKRKPDHAPVVVELA